MFRKIASLVAVGLLAAGSPVRIASAWDTQPPPPTLHASLSVWPLVDMTAPDPANPSDTPNLIGFQPTESADDVGGLTGQVSAPGAAATVVTVMQAMTNSADLKSVGLIFWNPVTNCFKWYGVVDGGSTSGVDVNRDGPTGTGPAGDLFPAPTFQPGDTWASVQGASADFPIQTSLYVNFKGSDNFRKYQLIGPSGVVAGAKGLVVSHGKVYFVDESPPGTINRLDPGSATSPPKVTTWVVGGVPHYLAVDPVGRIYATVANSVVGLGDAIVRVDPDANTTTTWTLPPTPPQLPLSPRFQPLALSTEALIDVADGIDLDDQGNVWFVESQAKKVGRLDPSIANPGPLTPNLTEFGKDQVSNPQQIAARGQGGSLQVLFTEGDGEALSLVTPAHTGVPVMPQTKPALTALTTVLTHDEIHTPKSARITPALYDLPAVDPEITRFAPLPPPPGAMPPLGSDASAPDDCVKFLCHPAGLTDAVLGGALGTYFDPMFTGSSAVFRTVVQSTAGQHALPPYEPGQGATGGGWVPVAGSAKENKGTFALAVKKSTSGQTRGRFEWQNRATGEKLRAEQIVSFAIAASTATFTGVARSASGARCDFRVTLQDNSRDGKLDTFKIEDDSGSALPACTTVGPATLGGGNVVVHN